MRHGRISSSGEMTDSSQVNQAQLLGILLKTTVYD